jgi:hypothetical protein
MRSVRHCSTMTKRLGNVLAFLIAPLPLAIYFIAITSTNNPRNVRQSARAYPLGLAYFSLSFGVLAVNRRAAPRLAAWKPYLILWTTSLITATLEVTSLAFIFRGVTLESSLQDLLTVAFAGFVALVIYQVLVARFSADPDLRSNA